MPDLTLAVTLPLLAALLRPLFDDGVMRWPGAVLGPLALVASGAVLVAHWAAFETPYRVTIGGFPPPLGIAFYADGLALLFALAAPLMTLLLWPTGASDITRKQSLSLLLAAALVGLALSGDLFNLYVFYELAAVASYGLIAASGGAALVAAFRYLMISALGSLIALLGIALIYFQTGTLNLGELATLAGTLDSTVGLAAFVMLLIGFGVKAELFPVNGWVPEVYAATDKRIAALLAGLASKLAVLVIVRVMVLIFPGEEARQLLMILGLAGIVTGELAAWKARDLARMLAWSSIAQLGIVLVAFSLPGEAGLIAGIAVALHHLVVKSALFVLAEPWGGAIDKLRGAAQVSALGAGLFVLFALSLLGIPPLPGFWSKFLVLGGLADGGATVHYIAMAIIVSATVIEGAYLLRVATTLYATPTGDARPCSPGVSGLLTGSLLATGLIVAALAIDPLWQLLSSMAVQAADVSGYSQTMLVGRGS